MKAQTLVKPFHFELRDVDAPNENNLLDGEVIVRVLAGAVCGSDVPYFKGQTSRFGGDTGRHAAELPGFPGHEIVGEIVAARASDLDIGQRVVGWAGGFDCLAEFVVTNSRSLLPIGTDAVPDDQIILQSLACVLHAVKRMGTVRGKRVAIIGLGPFGLLFSHVLHTQDAAHIIGIDWIDRTDVASTFFIDDMIQTSSERWIREFRDDPRPEIVIDAVGHQMSTLNHAVEAAAENGLLFYFGIADSPTYPFDMQKFQRKQLTLIAGSTPLEDQRAALSAAVDYLDQHPGLVSSYITNKFSFEEIQAAFECGGVPAEGRIKVAIRFN